MRDFYAKNTAVARLEYFLLINDVSPRAGASTYLMYSYTRVPPQFATKRLLQTLLLSNKLKPSNVSHKNSNFWFALVWEFTDTIICGITQWKRNLAVNQESLTWSCMIHDGHHWSWVSFVPTLFLIFFFLLRPYLTFRRKCSQTPLWKESWFCNNLLRIRLSGCDACLWGSVAWHPERRLRRRPVLWQRRDILSLPHRLS